jgi:hypothetical protein
MMAPRILGFVAVAALLAACAVGHRALRRDAGLRKAIGALLFCSVAGLTTSFVRQPLVVWPLAISMLAAMIFLVWTMHIETRQKRDLNSPLSE